MAAWTAKIKENNLFDDTIYSIFHYRDPSPNADVKPSMKLRPYFFCFGAFTFKSPSRLDDSSPLQRMKMMLVKSRMSTLIPGPPTVLGTQHLLLKNPLVLSALAPRLKDTSLALSQLFINYLFQAEQFKRKVRFISGYPMNHFRDLDFIHILTPNKVEDGANLCVLLAHYSF